MLENLGDYRKSYDKKSLTIQESDSDPMIQFDRWFKEVESSDGIEEVNAMTVATIGIDGFPKSRVVLLKNYSAEGFTFYTNYNSEKGRAIATNPHICISFFWPNLERQVIIQGKARKVSEKQSNTYFQARPKGSQLGALVSPQSEVIPDRKFLENRLLLLENEYNDKEIPRPGHWGGFLVAPHAFEFWQGRPNRLHDRVRYTGHKNQWKRERLAP
jgi:pyridoxamine 5'-phosphate oxidase